MGFAEKIKLPSRRIKKRARSLGWLYGVLAAIVLGLGAGLYTLNTTFRQNVDLAFSYFTFTKPEIVQSGPYVSEQDGRAFVLYDHALVNVAFVYDSSCRGARCDFPTLADEIKDQITPLIKFRSVDYRTDEGKELMTGITWNMLPVVIFDRTLEKVRGFDQLQELFVRDGDRYLLRLQPSTSRTLPDYSNALVHGFSNSTYPVNIVAYVNYACEYCARAQKVMEELLSKYPDDIRIYVKPLMRGTLDLLGARAAECAAAQGIFWDMHKLIFANYEKIRDFDDKAFIDKLMEFAHMTFIPDQVVFRKCLASDMYDGKFSKHLQEAQSLGVDSTPVFFINDSVIPGSMDLSEFEAVVRYHLGLE